MKRQEKQRAKAERRAQKKLANRTDEPSLEPELEVLSGPVRSEEADLPPDWEPQL
jgi:hypothetical protein